MSKLNEITEGINEIITLLDEWDSLIRKNQQDRIIKKRDDKINKILNGKGIS